MNTSQINYISALSIVPLRAKPMHKAELISQVLFGELVELLETREEWMRVRCLWDGYEGWVQSCQLVEYSAGIPESNYYSYDWCHPVKLSEHIVLVPMGAPLPEFDGMSFRINGKKIPFNGRGVSPDSNEWSEEKMSKLAKKYLNSPYLWGGRTPQGIDCSGFVQMVMRFFDIHLPRDSSDQAKIGEPVGFADMAEPGDLAYFSSSIDKRKITHVGIVLADRKIIHASGKVRIDHFNHEGIFSELDQSYSHYLRCIRRVRPLSRLSKF